MNQQNATPTETAVHGRPGAGALLVEQIGEAAGKRSRSRNVKPLARLLPYLAAHKGHALLSALFLVASTAASLALTATARGAIDTGFEDGGAHLNFWFGILGANALVLGLLTALRYFY
ncbi:MAG: ABC transporter, partial [Brevundimonas sp.]